MNRINEVIKLWLIVEWSETAIIRTVSQIT